MTACRTGAQVLAGRHAAWRRQLLTVLLKQLCLAFGAPTVPAVLALALAMVQVAFHRYSSALTPIMRLLCSCLQKGDPQRLQPLHDGVEYQLAIFGP